MTHHFHFQGILSTGDNFDLMFSPSPGRMRLDEILEEILRCKENKTFFCANYSCVDASAVLMFTLAEHTEAHGQPIQ